MNRMMAIVEREMRKFFRSPMLMIMSLMMPILQLVIIGNAFGGKIVGTHVAVVDYDHGPQAVKVREAFDAVAANIKTFSTIEYNSEVQAREDVRTGKIDAAVIIPAQYSRRVYAQDAPKLGFVVDNSDLFTSSALEAEMQSLVDAMNAPQIQDRLAKTIALEVVELYPYVNYLKYLLPMTVALAMYISVMIGGGMFYIDDKARGVHEGYLVTPITKLELVFGLNIAGAIKAVLSGHLPYRNRLAHRRAGHCVSSHYHVADVVPDRRRLHCLQRHDVSAHGARRRSAGSPRHVRRAQCPPAISLGRHVSHVVVPQVDAGHRRG